MYRQPHVSFVTPVHNDAVTLVRVLQAQIIAARMLGEPYEVTVVDRGSDDDSVTVATLQGANVLHTGGSCQVGARNHGGRAARGDYLFFVDADTLISAELVRAAWRVLRIGAVGGGAVEVPVDTDAPLARVSASLQRLTRRATKRPTGGFLFCTRAAFESAGGFQQALGERAGAAFVQALKAMGRFVVVAPSVTRLARAPRD